MDLSPFFTIKRNLHSEFLLFVVKYKIKMHKEGWKVTKVTRIYHSGFLIETEHYFLIFDYYTGQLPDLSGKKIVVFASHRHGDHYDECIFELEKQYSDISYVLYHDITNRKQENILYVQNHQSYDWEGLTVETLQSTDEGCAFLVKVDDKIYYHAGDLNWWHWDGEPEEFNQWQEEVYKKETDRLTEVSIDYAFVVLDPRQKQNATLGILELLKKCNIKHLFPMHFDCWGKREAVEPYLLLEEMKPYEGIIKLDQKVTFE